MAKLPGKKIDAERTWDAVARKYLDMFEVVIRLRASRLRRDDGNWLAGNWWHFTFDRINRIYRIKTWKCSGRPNRRGLRTEGGGR